ncbi:MAG TPA: hypothetical protein VH111_12160 [Steroidobacteraceae bacterium]|jgi:hypothetical protein|nr:hypothetical protein [Steroidobacteraceae bacterium]
MIDPGFERVIAKTRKLKELHRARARVLQLERELRGEPAKADEPFYIPEFLAQQPPRPAARPNLSVVELSRSAA